MRVILTQNIKGVGQIGDMKNVSDGHARNFLIPKGLAMPATDKAIKEAGQLRLKRESSKIVGEEKAAEAADKLKDATLTFSKKASKTGTLFSSVSKSEIAQQLSKLSGFEVRENMIDLGDHGEHIKKIGEHLIKLNLSNSNSVEVKVSVEASQ